MFLAEFLVGSSAILFKEEIHDTLKSELSMGIKNHYYLSNEEHTFPQYWNEIQRQVLYFFTSKNF